MLILRKHWLQVLTHIAALTPLALLIWDATLGNLSADPIRDVTLRTGKTALVLLVLSLAITPINTIFGIRSFSPVRRRLGLYAFFYATLHFLNIVGRDYRFEYELIWEDVGSKRFAQVGFATFVMLLLLALTSTRWCRKRLGRNWKRLHLLVYPATLLAVSHFYLQVKADTSEPVLFFGIVGILLFLRVPGIRGIVSAPRRRLERKRRHRP